MGEKAYWLDHDATAPKALTPGDGGTITESAVRSESVYRDCSPLGSVDIHRIQIRESGEIEEGEEVSGALAVASGDASVLLEFIEEALDTMAFGVEGEVAISRGFSV